MPIQPLLGFVTVSVYCPIDDTLVVERFGVDPPGLHENNEPVIDDEAFKLTI